jgi:hypothetical protein
VQLGAFQGYPRSFLAHKERSAGDLVGYVCPSQGLLRFVSPQRALRAVDGAGSCFYVGPGVGRQGELIVAERSVQGDVGESGAGEERAQLADDGA